METVNNYGRSRPVITQTLNNTTLWVGHLQTDPNDHFAGQTFECPATGELNNIQIFSSAVHRPGEMLLTVHAFDAATKAWGPALVSSSVEIDRNDSSKWLRFDLPSVVLQKGETYGFRLQAKDAFVAVGEAASGILNPFEGEEWHADTQDTQGRFYKYFSLAYKVEMCA